VPIKIARRVFPAHTLTQHRNRSRVEELQALEQTHPAESDDAIVARIAARDPVAFRLVVDREVKALHRIAYRMLGNATAAEDVAQEALLRLWSGAERWTGGGPGIAAWLRRVATNLCLDQLRKRRFVSDGAVDEILDDRADDAPLADAQIDEDRVREGVKAALDTLNARQRAAIILTYYEMLPNGAAAEALDMNVKAFESLLLRARHALKLAIDTQQRIMVDDVRHLS
jgi:RNA polymerase sigma factor (sigma-70 family)